MSGTYPDNIGQGGAGLKDLKTYLDEIWTEITALGAASGVTIADAGSRFTGEDVEAALQELAGADRTSETVKANKALIDTLNALNPMATQVADLIIQYKKVTLRGANPTEVAFNAATAAVVEGDNAETFDINDGQTFIANIDGGGAETATFNGAAATFDGGATASTDISGGPDTKLSIAVDADVDTPSYHEIELTIAGKNTGNLIAAEIQTKVQALGGIYASVTCVFSVNKYVVTSGSAGTGSKVRFGYPADHSLAEELQLNADDGSPTDGTGDAVDITAYTADEVVTCINGDLTGTPASKDGSDKIVITSPTTGTSSTIAIGSGTANTALGFTNSETDSGALGAGLSEMGDTSYLVFLALDDASDQSARGLTVKNKATTGFDIYCETAGATDDVSVLVIGAKA